MDGSRNIVNEMKKSMNLLETQGFRNGISSEDISRFLRKLVEEYRLLGRDVRYKWKRIEGSRDGQSNGFSGKHVERILRHKGGKFILFGKAARANAVRALMIRNLKKVKSERKKFEVYGSKALGQSRADHAMSICVGSEGKFMYDNKFVNVEKKFSVETLALHMADICYCYVFDISESV